MALSDLTLSHNTEDYSVNFEQVDDPILWVIEQYKNHPNLVRTSLPFIKGGVGWTLHFWWKWVGSESFCQKRGERQNGGSLFRNVEFVILYWSFSGDSSWCSTGIKSWCVYLSFVNKHVIQNFQKWGVTQNGCCCFWNGGQQLNPSTNYA